MLNIAGHQLREGLFDAKFIFVAVLVLLAFTTNGLIYAERFQIERDDWNSTVADTTSALKNAAENLMDIAGLRQRMVKPFSCLAFIADDGSIAMPNALTVDAFRVRNLDRQARANDRLPLLPAIDWVFIVGTLMSLLAILVGYGAVCGEKRDGTLRLVFSNPVSRLKLYLGKYLGTLSLLVVTLLLGVVIDVTILVFSGSLYLAESTLVPIAWAVVLSVCFLSLFVLLSLAVSSLVARPSVSLVLLLVVWTILIAAVPGAARLFGTQAAPVPDSFEIDRQTRDKTRELWQNAPDGAGSWNGDPFADFMPLRAALYNSICFEQQRMLHASYAQKLQQVRMVNTFAWVSPAEMLGDSLRSLCNTGVYGFEALFRYAKQYQSQLHDFIEERDRSDPDSPHHVYYALEPGTFSRKPVGLSSVPRWHAMWERGGIPREQGWPWLQMLLFLAGNLQVAVIAFIALARYDPR